MKEEISFFEKNLTILIKKSPSLVEKIKTLKNIDEDKYKLIAAKNNSLTAQIKDKDKSFFLHSRYNPESESDALIQQLIRDSYDIIFCGGFGLGYFIRSLFTLKYNDFSKLIIIEKDINILKLAFENFDFSDILKDDKIEILFEENNNVDGLNNILIGSVTKKAYTYISKVYTQLYPEFYLNLKNLIESYLSRKNINIATLVRFQKLWSRNIIKNHKLFLSSKGINSFFDKYQKKPALVISAGPSLNEYIGLIKKKQNRFIIIAVDSIFPVLIKTGIYPDFVITVDPQYINYKYFEYNKYFKSILVSELSTFPLILNSYRGKTIFFQSIFPLAHWFDRFTEPKGEIDMGGSVSTTAFDFAYKIGCDPIILLGQDLAFLNDMTHTKGSYAEKYWALRYNKFNTSFNSIYNYIHNNLFIKIKSSDNKLVNTDKRLMIFLVWFQNKMKNIDKERKVYNTSLKGAMIENMAVKGLNDILTEYDFNDLSSTKEEISKFDPSLSSSRYEELLKEAKKIKLNFNLLESIVEDSMSLSNKLYGIIEKQKNQDLSTLIKKLDKNDKKIREVSDISNFLGMIIQDKIYSIMEDYENYLTEKEKNNNDLKIARRNIILYSGINESIQLFKTLFNLIN